MESDNGDLAQFGRHVPRVLKQQLISACIEKIKKTIIDSKNEDFAANSVPLMCEPSIERFHSALLFVDISGFTVLSQKLNVDQLRTFINLYFKKIIDIVDKYGGDVIKFAGDALFIVWKTSVRATDDKKFEVKCHDAIAGAVACGMEIIANCSNYQIELNSSAFDQKLKNLLDIISPTNKSGAPKNFEGAPSADSRDEDDCSVHSAREQFAYLNVHAGASIGIMAGIDVGANNRWEYLLVGQPLVDVAVAESEAEKGELVISEAAHKSLHPEGNCHCTRTASNNFIISANTTFPENGKKHEPVSIIADIGPACSAIKQGVITQKKIAMGRKELLEYCEARISDLLLDDLACHVHEAARSDYVPYQVRSASYSDSSSTSATMTPGDSPASLELPSIRPGSRPTSSGGDRMGKLPALNLAIQTRKGNSISVRDNAKMKHDRLLSDSSALMAELRLITVMFISIDLKGLRLHISEPGEKRTSTCLVDSFHFLSRTQKEVDADFELLSRCQRCMEVVTTAFQENSGQLRQFIVDDKGTVCIGTFGLRGAANYDNAKAAIETGRAIISHLQLAGMNASVGITSGKAYCGLVGSPQRHEFAVMGPSTNLSARLMGKALPGEIICDIETRNSDRSHSFMELSAVKAKGYEQLVPTFKPLFDSPLQLLPDTFSTVSASMKVKVVVGSLPPLDCVSPAAQPMNMLQKLARQATSRRYHMVLRGRNVCMRKVVTFLQPLMVPFSDGLMEMDGEAMVEMVKTAMDNCHNREPMDDFDAPLFKVDVPSRMACMMGPHGIGKTVFLKEFGDRVTSLAKRSNSINAASFRNKPGAMSSSEPFSFFKSIFKDIFSRAAQLDARHTSFSSSTRGLGGASKDADIVAGADYLISLLGEMFESSHPLLSSIGLLPPQPDNEVTKTLTGATRLGYTVELLAALLQQYVTTSNRMTVLVIDDLQLMDALSTHLLAHIWQHNTGLLLLTSYRMNLTQSSGSSDDNSDLLPDVLALAGRGTTDFSVYENSDRFTRIELSNLNVETGRELIDDVFLTHTKDTISSSVFDSIHGISGGNPLYMYEISTALAKKYVAMSHSKGPDEDNHKLMELVKNFRTNRIEEVICFRFDQLGPMHQILLKMASVACSLGSFFSLPMLAYMLHSDKAASSMDILNSGKPGSDIMSRRESRRDSHRTPSGGFQLMSSADKVATVLNDLLDKGEFVRVVVSTASGDSGKEHSSHLTSPMASDKNSLELLTLDDPAVASQLQFEFMVGLERNAIYDLMLNDQKESFHDRVASFLESERHAAEARGDDVATPAQLSIEAFHWEQATVWCSAMRCYYLSGMALDKLGALVDSRHQFTSAYKMLDYMKKDCGISPNMQVSTPKLKRRLKDAIAHSKGTAAGGGTIAEVPYCESVSAPPSVHNPQGHGAQGGAQGGAQAHNKLMPEKEEVYRTTKEDVYLMFGGDSEMLETGLNVLLRLGQSCLTLGNNPVVTSKLYEEALELLTIVKSTSAQGLMANQGSNKTVSIHVTTSAMSRLLGQEDLHLNIPQSDVKRFDIKDSSICFPILSGIIVLYRTRKLVDDANMSKECLACNLFLTIAQSSPAYGVHLMVGLTFLRNIYTELNRIEDGIELIETAREKYNYSRDSPEITKHYGSDRMPRVFAVNAQILFMLGRFRQMDDYFPYLKEMFPHITHLNTLAMLCVPLCVLLVQNGQCTQALEWFTKYMRVETAQKGGVSHFRELNPIAHMWLNLHCKLRELVALSKTIHDAAQKKVVLTEAQVSTLDDFERYCDAPESIKIAKAILDKGYYKPVNRPFLFAALDFFGLGVEYMCAAICLMRVKGRRLVARLRHSEGSAAADSHELAVAVDYIQIYIKCVGTDSNFVFCKYVSLLLKAELLLMVTRTELEISNGIKNGSAATVVAASVESHTTKEGGKSASEEALEALQACEAMARHSNYWTALLHTSLLYQTLHVDEKYGARLQQEALEHMSTVNGVILPSVYTDLIEAFKMQITVA